MQGITYRGVQDGEQGLCIFLVQSAVVDAILFEFAVERHVSNYHPRVPTVHGHP